MTIYHTYEKIELIRNILQKNGGEEQKKWMTTGIAVVIHFGISKAR